MSNLQNPLIVLRNGIALANWPMVQAAYTELTGEEAPEAKELAIVSASPTKEPEKKKRGRPKKNAVVEPPPSDDKQPEKPHPAAHRANIEDFRVPDRGASRARSEGGTYARLEDSLPMEENRWDDDLTEARKELAFDKMLVEKGVRPAQRAVESRPPPTLITVTCRECDKKKEVSPKEAPIRRLAKDDKDGSTYVCDDCIGKKARGRRGG